MGRLLTREQLCSLKGLPKSNQTLWDWRQHRHFPEPIRPGRSNLWDEDEVDQWIAAHLDRRRKKGPSPTLDNPAADEGAVR